MPDMGHYSTVLKIVIDVPPAEHDRELAFWHGAICQDLPRFDFAEYHGTALHGHDFWLLEQRPDAGTPRVHLDIRPVTSTPS